jgi:hypothetical protein
MPYIKQGEGYDEELFNLAIHGWELYFPLPN